MPRKSNLLFSKHKVLCHEFSTCTYFTDISRFWPIKLAELPKVLISLHVLFYFEYYCVVKKVWHWQSISLGNILKLLSGQWRLLLKRLQNAVTDLELGRHLCQYGVDSSIICGRFRLDFLLAWLLVENEVIKWSCHNHIGLVLFHEWPPRRAKV